MTMTPSQPYLLRALYEWIADNGLTPYITVDVNVPEVAVPSKYIKNDKIVLNISTAATKHLRIGNDAIEFQARFQGKVHHVYIPVLAVLAIFAHETGRGMAFSSEYSPGSEGGSDTGGSTDDVTKPVKRKPPKPKKPHLTLVTD